VFAINTDGTGFRNLYSFTATDYFFPTNSDGAHPLPGLVLSGNTLYGTAYGGGNAGKGTVFAINIDGSSFTTLHSFSAASGTSNSDGANPTGLILSGNTIYGTGQAAGTNGYGTVFALNTNGTDFTTLHNFTGGSDGAAPLGDIISSGNTLYGTASTGGSSVDNSGSGIVYMANCCSGCNWQFKQPVAMALPTIILKAGCLGFWATCFLVRCVAG
jgi:uncharacterized repeat protein (TIGR03803 family)